MPHRKKHTSALSKARPYLNNELWIREQYLDKKLSTLKIGKLLRVDPWFVSLALRSFGIKARIGGIVSELKFRRRYSSSYLDDLYFRKGYTLQEIGNRIGRSVSAVYQRIRKLRITRCPRQPVRKPDRVFARQQVLLFILNELNLGYSKTSVSHLLSQHGISEGMAEKCLSGIVYSRDGRTCACCLRRIPKSKQMDQHHICCRHKFKELRFCLWNIISVCGACHRRVHSKNSCMPVPAIK